MRTSFKVIGLVSALALGAVALQGALAGPGPYGMGPGGQGSAMYGQTQGMGRMGGMGGMGPALKMTVEIDQAWVEKTKADLGISKAQNAAWDAYVEALKTKVQTMRDFRAARDPATMGNLTWEDRMTVRADHRETHWALMQEIEKAKTTLLDQLSEDQKAKAAVLPPARGYGRFSSQTGDRPCPRR